MNFRRNRLKPLHQFYNQGYTLVELMITVAIVGILVRIAIPAYQDYIERTRVYQAITDISAMSVIIEHYFQENREYPSTLAEVNLNTKLDPWGHTYRYLNLVKNGNGGARRDRSLNPLNSDFDIYSVGKDNDTRLPISHRTSDDDVIRIFDGKFVDLAIKF